MKVWAAEYCFDIDNYQAMYCLPPKIEQKTETLHERTNRSERIWQHGR
jgi:hypothetical protein